MNPQLPARNHGFALAFPHTGPCDPVSRRRQRRRVSAGGTLEPGFGIAENIDFAGEPRAGTVDGDTACNVAVGLRCAASVRNTSD
jgi:hypothetical protein